jgi:hypothetical protein
MTARVRIDAGICGFRTTVVVRSEDNQNVAFDIESDCDKIRGLAGVLQKKGTIDAFQEISPVAESVVLGVTRKTLRGCCAGCIVPVGVFKGMQVAAGLALPKHLLVEIEKEEEPCAS